MAPWKKLLPKSANFGKFEKEEKQKYKQYVKIEKQNAELRSKPESEVYEDFLLSRSKSSRSRRSSKKRSAPIIPHKVIENSYEIIEGQTSNNVVVINDDLRNRFAGYELPKIQENVYVVVQSPHEAEEAEKPRRLRWKIPLPQPPQPPMIAPDDQHPQAQEKTSPQPKGIALRVPDDDQQETSMSEVYYDCEEYVEIAQAEDLKESRQSYSPLDADAKATEVSPIKTYPTYDSISEGSLTRSYEVEYAEHDDYYEDQKVYNRYAPGEDAGGSEDESRWQPSNVRFCEMSGDEEEQQIYGPFGTFEVANYQNTLNNRIQTVVENEIQSVMISLEDSQWKGEEAADQIDGGKVIFEFVSSKTFLNQPSEDDFGAAGAFETTERQDEEFLVEARNIALIDKLEKPQKDDLLDLKGDTLSNLHEDIQTVNVKSSPKRLFELTAKNLDGPTPFHRNPRPRTLEDPKEAKNVDELAAAHLELRGGIHEDPEGANTAVESTSAHPNLRAEIRADPKRAKNVGGPTSSHPKLRDGIHEDLKEDKNVGGPTSHHPKLREGIHDDPPKEAKNVDGAIPSHPKLHQGIHEDTKGAKNIGVPTSFHPKLRAGIHEDPKRAKNADEPTSSYLKLRDGIHENPKEAKNLGEPISSHPKLHEGIHEDPPKEAKNVDGPIPSHRKLRQGIHEDPKGAKNIDVPTSFHPKLRKGIHEEPNGARNFPHHLKVPTPPNLHQEDYEEVLKDATEELDVPPIPSSKPPDNIIEDVIIKKEEKVVNGVEQNEGPQVPSSLDVEVKAERKKSPQLSSSSSFRLIDNYSAFLMDPMSMMMTPRLNSRPSFKKDDPKPTTYRKEDGDGYQSVQFNPPTSREDSPPHLKKAVHPTPLEISLRSSSKVEEFIKIEEDNPKPTTQRKEDGDAYQNLQFNPPASREDSPPHLKKPLHSTPLELSPRSSSKIEESSKIEGDDPKPTIQRKEDGVAYQNLQFNPPTSREDSPPHVKKLLHPTPLELSPYSSSKVEESSKIEGDDPKPIIQRKEDGDAYQNLQFTPPTREEASPLHLKKSLHSTPLELSLRSPSKKEEPSKIEENNPKPGQHEENGDTYENFKFDRTTRIEDSKKSPQGGPGYRKTPVAQPRLNLSSFKRNRLLHRTKSDLEPTKGERKRPAQTRNTISDLFNGLPVAEAEVLERDMHQENQNSQKIPNHEPFNGSLAPRQKKVLADKLNPGQNLKIPWETKNRTSPNDSGTFMYFGTQRTQGEVQNQIPRNTELFLNKAEEEKVRNEVVPNPWETDPKPFSGDEDTSIFFDNVMEKEEEMVPNHIPWETRPNNTFVPFGKAPEEEFANQVQDATLKLNLPKTPDEVGDYENVPFNPLDKDSEAPDYANMKIPWKTKPSNLERNKTISDFDDATVTSNDYPFKEKISAPEKLGQNIAGLDPNPQNLKNKDIITTNTYAAPLTGTDPDGHVRPKELGHDYHLKLPKDLEGDEGSALWGSNPFIGEVGKTKQVDPQDSNPQKNIIVLERSHSLKQKTWHVNLLEKYDGPNLNQHENEAGGNYHPNANDGDAKIVEQLQVMISTTQTHSIDDDKADQVETQNEANILEENYRILRGFDVVKEEGVIYHRDVLHTPPVPPQRPFKKTKISKKVSFRISDDTPDVSDEGPNLYIPVHSPTEKTGHIQRSAALEAITRRMERTPRLQHSMSLAGEPEKPKPNFSTFPRRSSRNQNSSPEPNSELDRLQQVLSGINDLMSVHEQVSAMEDISNKVKERVDKYETSGHHDDEYSVLLQIMFRSVRIATTLDCGFDSDLLARQQTVLDEIRRNMSTLNSK